MHSTGGILGRSINHMLNVIRLLILLSDHLFFFFLSHRYDLFSFIQNIRCIRHSLHKWKKQLYCQITPVFQLVAPCPCANTQGSCKNLPLTRYTKESGPDKPREAEEKPILVIRHQSSASLRHKLTSLTHKH